MNVRTLCLAILYFGEVTGYEIKKLAEDGKFSYFIEASFGAIYPALTRMSKEGLVTWRSVEQEGKPSRKVYSITPDGRKEFISSLYTAPKPDRFKSEFLLMMLCSSALDVEYVTKLIDSRVCELEVEMNMMEKELIDSSNPSEAFVINYGIHMQKASLEYLQNHRSLVEEQDFSNS
ncbi:MAG: helix-turn-helix transcriptional regulator [Rhizobiales bacterium]|nr:helix-turn-helix transcriptional regulator [Hyphomicrobiales bacterium]